MQLLGVPHPWLMEELLLNDSSAAKPKFRSSVFGALPAPRVPGDWAWRGRDGKSPKKEEPTQVLILEADIEQQGQVFLSTALRKFHFFGSRCAPRCVFASWRVPRWQQGCGGGGQLWNDWTQHQQDVVKQEKFLFETVWL